MIVHLNVTSGKEYSVTQHAVTVMKGQGHTAPKMQIRWSSIVGQNR